jgi:hypothetical protein
VFRQADFVTSGGCGDVFIWATSADDGIGFTLQWDQAASTAWEQSGFDGSKTLPDAQVQLFLVHGRSLSQTFCADIGGMGSVDGHAPATGDTVDVEVTPDAGGVTEQWRIDLVEFENLSVGWFAG